ncbi:hypothetical protein ABQE45_18035 [Mycobacteroides chelonae]
MPTHPSVSALHVVKSSSLPTAAAVGPTAIFPDLVPGWAPGPGETQHRRLGTYAASISGNKDGAVLVAFGG